MNKKGQNTKLNNKGNNYKDFILNVKTKTKGDVGWTHGEYESQQMDSGKSETGRDQEED